VLVVGALQNSLMLERMPIHKYECLFLVIWIYRQHFHQFLLLPLIYRLRVLERMSALNFYSLRIIRLMPSIEKKFLVITSVPVQHNGKIMGRKKCKEQLAQHNGKMWKLEDSYFLIDLVFMTLVVKLKFWTFFISTCKIRKDSHFAAIRCIDMHQDTGWNLYN
jgi:hypothetical protein